MIREIISKLENKKIAILGFGREGKSTYKFLKKYMDNPDITILDKNKIDLDDCSIKVVEGDKYLEDLGRFDFIIKSPGVILKDISIDKFKDKITSQLELLLEVYRDNVIGITGTKGKSTTSSLLYEVIKSQGKDVYLLGNIGVPIFDNIESYKDDTILVIEMSSHQLEFVKHSPHIGVILNLFQDHLDHAGSVEHYHDNKMNIFKFQDENDYAIYASDNSYLEKRISSGKYLGIKYDISFDNKNISLNSVRNRDGKIYLNDELLYQDGERLLVGEHNLKNIMFVVTILKILGLDLETACEVIANFKGLKYRLEYIGTYNDVSYYNDTIATIPEATINGILSLKNVSSLIFGGLDRGIDYSSFIDFLEKSKIDNFICMPSTGTMIGEELKLRGCENVYFVNTLEEAYEIAEARTVKGGSCLLSPAAASYEYFKNYEEKGEAFYKIVTSANKRM